MVALRPTTVENSSTQSTHTPEVIFVPRAAPDEGSVVGVVGVEAWLVPHHGDASLNLRSRHTLR